MKKFLISTLLLTSFFANACEANLSVDPDLRKLLFKYDFRKKIDANNCDLILKNKVTIHITGNHAILDNKAVIFYSVSAYRNGLISDTGTQTTTVKDPDGVDIDFEAFNSIIGRINALDWQRAASQILGYENKIKLSGR